MTSGSSELVRRASEMLRVAEEQRKVCAPLRELMPEIDIASAYAVQSLNIQHRVEKGGRIVGRKIGLTSAVVQQQLGVDEPDFGTLLSDMEVPHGGTVPYGRLIQPRVEAEIAFVLERDLAAADPTIADIIQAIAFALPAIEIVDSRIADWDIKIVDTVADNGSAARYVLGTSPRTLHQLDLELCGMEMTNHGQRVSTGLGLACLGNPLNAVRWLANMMVRMGTPLRAGDLLLSGALGPMIAAKPGDRFEARINSLGSVSVSFAGEA